MLETRREVMEATEHLCILKRHARPSEENEISALMRQLRKKQSSLKKAIDRKYTDLESVENQSMKTEACTLAESQTLSSEEVDTIVQTIFTEEQQCSFEPLADEVVSDSDPKMSPEIPYLPGLARLTCEKNQN